ncbi:Cof-type HAD-IIB family hydrolase [Alicyclobacillus sp. ALC3]|uniref:Cof-type HAD-IIB family hydrolase n=1 Tax=Alicyclobacillus sp. ALC3 TaxID=2796143 RepID=UPI00237A015D|nr:Cof-type HAD-IIB family hydrolase [Alicyclobacillus sp. ALC3]WDL98749.1 HAD family phosphatase [Alicyclobacillus sp. ALC3]
MGDWKLIALDMDGTLLAPDESISHENLTAIEQARAAGIEVTIATGRAVEGVVWQHAKALGLTMPLVTVNGGEVWSMEGELLYRRPLVASDVLELHQLALSVHAHFWGRTTERFVRNDNMPENAATAEWLKFGFYSDDADIMDSLWETLGNDSRFELTNSGRLNIEVNAAGVTKAAGLQLICDRAGIDANQVIAMGDSLNDISMLRWAGLGVAMGNAQEVVKEAADTMTGDCLENGVAQAIRRILND